MNLVECTIVDLVSELSRRTPAGAVALLVPDDAQALDPSFYTWGNPISVVGLSAVMARNAVSGGQCEEASGQ